MHPQEYIQIEQFVQQHIVCGATMLIYNLHQEGRLDEEYWHLLYSIDWDSAEQDLNDNGCHLVEEDGQWGVYAHGVCHYKLDTKFEAIEAYFDYDLSEYEVEILEWWVVSEWLLEKLKEKGETVEQFYGLPIWGRVCSGQAIALDGVIQNIFRQTRN